MDRGRVARDVVVVKRNVGRVVCELISLCLVYSAQVPAHDQDRDGNGSREADSSRTLSESLDRKRDGDGRDQDHDYDHGHGHDGGHGHGHGAPGGGGCPTKPSGTPVWNAAASNTGMWNVVSNWTGASTVPSGSAAVAEFSAAKVATVNYNTTSTIGALQFDAGAPTYTFNILSGDALTLAGAGIDNRSSSVPVFNVTGRMNFTNSASASLAALVANSGGVIDFSGVTAGAASAGSIAGAGTYALGRVNLSVGSLGTSTTVSGGILDGGVSGGTGGSISKIGTGTLTFTGADTYTGGTTVNSGTLAVNGGGRIKGTSGITLGQNAKDNGTLQVSGAASSVTTPGSITVGSLGTGTLTIDNGATVTAAGIILGASSGSTGTLNIGSGGAAGVLNALTVTNAVGATGIVNFNATDSSYTFGASLRNTLTLNQNGSGTTILTGTNTYTGGTNLNAGTLRVSSNANLGGAAGNLSFNGGTLQLGATITNLSRPITLNTHGGSIDTGSFSLTSTGNISGAGGLTKAGSGTLTLSGVSTYTGGTTVSAGILRGSTDSLQGNIVDNGNVTFLQVADGTYAGVMSGTGSLTKLSAGNLTMTGAGTYSGSTTVTAGTLTANGSLKSPVTAGISGVLAGIGTVNGSVNVLGTLSPGTATTPFGTLTIKGNLQLASGSVLQVNTDGAGDNSKVNVIGTAAMAGSISVLAGSSNYSANTRYTVLSASNGLTVTGPTAATTDMAFLTPSVSSNANNLYVTLTRNSTSFSAVAKSSNERATANYLQAVEASATTASAGASSGVAASVAAIHNSATEVLGHITQMTATQARNSFAQLAGSDLTQFSLVSRVNTSRVIDMLGDRLAFVAMRGAGIEAPEFTLTQADLYDQSRGAAFGGGDARGGFWIRSLGTQGSDRSRTTTGGDGAPAAVDWSGSGLAVGFDNWLNGNALVGGSFSYTSSVVGLDSTQSDRGKVSTPQVVLYTGLVQGGLQLRAMVGYGHDFYDSERSLTIGSDTTPATAVHGANELSGYTEANYTLQGPSDYQLQPVVGLRFVQIGESAYAESGSIGSLAVAARETQSLASNVGFRVIHPLSVMAGSVEVKTIWNHEYGEKTPKMIARLAGDDSDGAFTVAGASIVRDTLQLGASVNARLRNNVSAHLDYSVQTQPGNGAQQFLSAGISYVW
jgi:fibronectin-binding autotransporter adhesin